MSAPLGPSVLIVDDEQLLCEAIGEIVRRCGYLAVTIAIRVKRVASRLPRGEESSQ